MDPHVTEPLRITTSQHALTFLRLIICYFYEGRLSRIHIQIAPPNETTYGPSSVLPFLLYFFPLHPTLQHPLVHSILFFRSTRTQHLVNHGFNTITPSSYPPVLFTVFLFLFPVAP